MTSRYEIWFVFGWPYETSVAMARLVFGAYFDTFPNLKIITHHMGGMIPYFAGRVGTSWEQLGNRTSAGTAPARGCRTNGPRPGCRSS
jgi:aminocarboxymuconate-semialdehyde decarboxylase